MSLEGSCDVTVRGDDADRSRGARRVRRRLRLRLRAARRGRRRDQRARRSVRAAERGLRRRAADAATSRADAVPVELRGAGQASRQVNNFCTPDAFEASKLIACEVLTPAATGRRTRRTSTTRRATARACSRRSTTSRSRPDPTGEGVGYQRVYGHESADIDVLAEVRSGDAVLIPHGWHGPSMAAPGYDLYYLNVMAGPADRARLADLRRPRARLDSRHVGRPRQSTSGCRSAQEDSR